MRSRYLRVGRYPIDTVLEFHQILIPPAKTMAIVEFLQPSEARSAFTYLAYRRFKDTLLYLEKAPVGVFKTKYDPTQPVATTKQSAEGKKPQRSMDIVEVQTEATEAEAEGATLFIKNLSFSTTEDRLRNAFAAVQGFRSARIKWKNDPKAPGKKLSMGFGFVEFTGKEAAAKAMKAMQVCFGKQMNSWPMYGMLVCRIL